MLRLSTYYDIGEILLALQHSSCWVRIILATIIASDREYLLFISNVCSALVYCASFGDDAKVALTHERNSQKHIRFLTKPIPHKTDSSPNRFLTKVIPHQTDSSPNLFLTKPVPHQIDSSQNRFLTKPIPHQSDSSPKWFLTKLIPHQIDSSPNRFLTKLVPR